MNEYDLPGVAAVITSVSLLLGAIGWGKWKGGRLTTKPNDPHATLPEKLDALVSKADAALVSLSRIEREQGKFSQHVTELHRWQNEQRIADKAVRDHEARRRS